MYGLLFKQILDNHLVLTANEHLSHTLTERFLSFNEIHGNPTSLQGVSSICSLSQWIVKLWRELNTIAHNQLTLLNEFQEQWLWEDVIKQSNTETELLSVGAMARLARQAWQLIHQYNVPLVEFEAQVMSDDQQIFYEWFIAFQKHCDNNNWVTNDRLPHCISTLLTQHVLSNSGLLPKKIILIGFIEVPPHYQRLFNHLSSLGIQCKHYALPTAIRTSSYRVTLPNSDAEIETMARFAKQRLLMMEQNQIHTGIIGCVVPQLSKIRSKVVNIFTEVCSPHLLMPDQNKSSVPFNIFLGQPLTAFPLIQCAFQCLSLNKSVLTFEAVSSVTMSPFIAYADTEWSLRTQLDIGLRQHADCKLTLEQWRQYAKQYHCSLLSKQLKLFGALCNQLPLQLDIAQWIVVFKKLLNSLGWPGEQSLSSFEYQLYNRWEELLKEVSTSNLNTKQICYMEAVNNLEQIAAAIIFQGKTEPKQIQILGTLETVGLEFDSLWVMGLEDDQWPAPPSRNPLLPFSLQQRYKMPHSSAEQEYQYSKKMTQYFLSHSSTCIFSASEWEKDRPLRVSNLIKAIPLIQKENLSLAEYEPLDVKIFNSVRYYPVHDEFGPMISDAEESRGGSSLFKYQAACPFKAFAELRLGAKELPVPQLALLPSERGAIIHKVLEKLWLEIKTKSNLIRLDSHELNRLLENIIDSVLQQVACKKPLTIHPTFIAIEKQRLTNLIVHWLENEKNRPEFEVMATELSVSAEVKQLTIQMRIDRIDRLADNRLALIDYKTGNASIYGWFGERMDEPQLPLYCITAPNSISALLFGKIQYSSKGYVGISENSIDLSGVVNCHEVNRGDAVLTWTDQLQQWTASIYKLADEFYNGYAKVDPKDGIETCLTCHLQGLCRYKGVTQEDNKQQIHLKSTIE